jgi:hypothetical protein
MHSGPRKWSTGDYGLAGLLTRHVVIHDGSWLERALERNGGAQAPDHMSDAGDDTAGGLTSGMEKQEVAVPSK